MGRCFPFLMIGIIGGSFILFEQKNAQCHRRVARADCTRVRAVDPSEATE